MRPFDANTQYEIVGVVGDTVYTMPREGMVTTLYVPIAQRKPSEFWEAARLDPATVLREG